MNGYKYKFVGMDGKVQDGVMSAKSENEVIEFLRSRNQFALEIEQEGKKSIFTKDVKVGVGRVNLISLVIFCRQLAAMLKAGMPLDRAMSTQQSQTENKAMRDALQKLDSQIKQGMVMSVAMAEQPKAFPSIFVRAIEAGEKTGNLDNALIRMATHFHKMLVLRRKIRGAMSYPLIVLALTIAIASFLIIWAIPQFADFLGADGDLPALTQFYVNLSDALRTFWWAFILGIVGSIFGVRTLLRSDEGRVAFDRLKIKIPKAGRLVREILSARFTRTFSSMVASGITIVDAIEISATSMGNKYVEDKVLEIIDEVKKGAPVSDQLRSIDVFPPMMVSMLAVGEETGSIDEMLGKVADYYEEESEAALDKLLAMINPLMMVLIAAIVGSIVLAMYLPMFEAIGAQM